LYLSLHAIKEENEKSSHAKVVDAEVKEVYIFTVRDDDENEHLRDGFKYQKENVDSQLKTVALLQQVQDVHQSSVLQTMAF